MRIGEGFQRSDFESRDIVYVLPGQAGEAGAATFFVVDEIEPRITFTTPFPEGMTNDSGVYFPFEVRVLRGRKTTLGFRYTDQVTTVPPGITEAGIEPGALIFVLPGQQIDAEFLDEELDEGADGTIYYGRTGLSFDPKEPEIAGKVFLVKTTVPSIRFTEPFPEFMRNDWSSRFLFQVVVVSMQ